MNNTNINAILEAVGELDNSVLENAFKPRKKKPIALVVIAAAAAVSLLVGFTTINRNRVVRDGETLFDVVFKEHREAVIPPLEEMAEMGYLEIVKRNADKPEEYNYFILAKPSEVIKKYNLSLLVNDNFSEDVTIDDYPKDIFYDGFYSEESRKLFPRTSVDIKKDMIYFQYYLVDKQSGTAVDLDATFFIRDVNFPGVWVFFGKRDYKVLNLNTGEKAIIIYKDASSSSAHFTYDGVAYHITAYTDINGTEQILKNLGITAE